MKELLDATVTDQSCDYCSFKSLHLQMQLGGPTAASVIRFKETDLADGTTLATVGDRRVRSKIIEWPNLRSE